MEGRWNFRLCEKLKRLKARLRWWNKEIFGWVDRSVETHVINLNALDNLLIDNHGGSIGRLVEERSKCVENLWNKMELKEGMLRHKSRQLWLKEGDRNSQFFSQFLEGPL